MAYAEDPRVVLTLDAGGTNFVFSAVRGDREVVEPVTLPSNAHDLTLCLETIVEGFAKVKEKAPAAAGGHQLRLPRPRRLPERDHRRPREPARVQGRGHRPGAHARGPLRASRSSSTTTATSSPSARRSPASCRG